MFNTDEVARANRSAGFHFFDADTLRFFRSRILPGVVGGRFFVTSEQKGFDASSGRGYSVREFMPDGSIEELGEFNEYSSPAQARRAANRAAKETHSYYFEGQHGKGGRRVTYVVTEAVDPWNALERLHSNFRVFNMGRARDYMTPDTYPHLQAR
jgi:hypothetical protein